MNVAIQLKTTVSTYMFETTYNELAHIRSNYHIWSRKYYRTVHKKNHSSSSRGHTLERRKEEEEMNIVQITKRFIWKEYKN